MAENLEVAEGAGVRFWLVPAKIQAKISRLLDSLQIRAHYRHPNSSERSMIAETTQLYALSIPINQLSLAC